MKNSMKKGIVVWIPSAVTPKSPNRRLWILFINHRLELVEERNNFLCYLGAKKVNLCRFAKVINVQNKIMVARMRYCKWLTKI